MASSIPNRSVAVIMPAAGSGRRFGAGKNKLWMELDGRPLWYHAAARLAARPEVGRLVMPVSAVDRPLLSSTFQPLVESLNLELVDGGDSRTESVWAGIEQLAGDQTIRFIAVHDAARPLVSDGDLAAVIAAAWQRKAAILAIPVAGTVKRQHVLKDGETSLETVDRRDLWIALTPQVFDADLLKRAYRQHNGRPATDDAELVERAGHPVAIVQGAADNLKITFPEDLLIAEAIFSRQQQSS